VGGVEGPRVRPKRTAVIDLYTRTPAGTTVVCVDELGPLIPRTYPAQPGWTAHGNRVKEEVAYGRGPEKTWVYGGLRIRDGHAVNADHGRPRACTLSRIPWNRSSSSSRRPAAEFSC
jgi:hypothetical protein